jgi:hypothetical protein
MQIGLSFSKFNDLDLYAYFIRIKSRRSTLIKQMIRDYIHETHTINVEHLTETADIFEDKSLPKVLSVPVFIGKSDSDIVEYLKDCPPRMRAKCIKNILHIVIAPYAQSVYHYGAKPAYVPASVTEAANSPFPAPRTPEILSPPVEFWQNLISALQGVTLQTNLPVTANPSDARQSDVTEDTIQTDKPMTVEESRESVTQEKEADDILPEEKKTVEPTVEPEISEPTPAPEPEPMPQISRDMVRKEAVPIETDTVSTESSEAPEGIDGEDDDMLVDLFGVDFG